MAAAAGTPRAIVRLHVSKQDDERGRTLRTLTFYDEYVYVEYVVQDHHPRKGTGT